MQACRNRKEELMLDVFGELTAPAARRDWEAHLRSCQGCSSERDRLVRLLGEVKQSGQPPDAPADLADRVGWRLRNERLPHGKAAGRRFRLVPALAAACALLVMSLAGYLVVERRVGPRNGADLTAELQLPQQDLEVIQHLDLLREMDTIEKLMHAVDTGGNGQPPAETNPETQGMQSNAARSTQA
jgi:hypothetical protein